ncbi:MAG: hypothetical protein KKG59_02885 [Nanoarchaeota archaeon]|nr:hypothetical protein [Nanoarchaeota archaeon]
MREVRHSKRGQAAIEYLITYGWVVMIVLIIVGIGFYFGILKPTQFIEESCTSAPQIPCIDAAIGRDGWILINVQNSLGDTINITDVETRDFVIDPTGGGAVPNPFNVSSNYLLNGRKTQLRIYNAEGYAPGELIEITFNIEFRRAINTGTPPPLHNISGKIYRRVCDGDIKIIDWHLDTEDIYIEFC